MPLGSIAPWLEQSALLPERFPCGADGFAFDLRHFGQLIGRQTPDRWKWSTSASV
jgi:hypothetical protein